MHEENSILHSTTSDHIRNGYLTSDDSIGLFIKHLVLPTNISGGDDSFENGIEGMPGASPAIGDSDSEAVPTVESSISHEEEKEEGEGETAELSDSSSAMFEKDLDPEGWAERLDELAGVLEVGEEEARAMRWGLPLDLDQDGGF